MVIASVTDINPLPVSGGGAAVRRRVIIVGWVVLLSCFECHGKFCGGIDIAKQNISQGISTFLAGVPRMQKRRNPVQPSMRINVATRVQDNDGTGVFSGDVSDEIILGIR